EAETTNIPPGPEFLALVDAARAMCAILNDSEMMTLGDLVQAIHWDGMAAHVDGHNNRAVGSYLPLEIFKTDGKGVLIHIDEYGNELVIQSCRRSGHESDCGHEDLAPSRNPHRRDGEMKGSGGRIDTHRSSSP